MSKRIILFSTLISFVCFISAFAFWRSSSMANDPTKSFSFNIFFPDGTIPFNNSGSFTRTITVFSKSLDLDKVKKIEINTESIDVNLVVPDKKESWVKLNANPDLYSPEDIHLEYAGDTLKISINENKKIHFNTAEISGDETGKRGLTLDVPSTIPIVSVKTVDGHLTVNKLKLTKLIFATTSGDSDIAETTVDDLEIYNVSGDTKMSGDIKKLSHKTTSGDLSLALANPSPNLDIATVSGDTMIKISKPLDARVSFSSVSGGLNLNLQEVADESIGGVHIDKTIGKGTGLIQVKSVSGDLDIQ